MQVYDPARRAYHLQAQHYHVLGHHHYHPRTSWLVRTWRAIGLTPWGTLVVAVAFTGAWFCVWMAWRTWA